MNTVIAVPMKNLSVAKSRLSTDLDKFDRQHVAFSLFAIGQRFLAEHFGGIPRVVITACPLIKRTAECYGATVLPEPRPLWPRQSDDERVRDAGLNLAAQLALSHARNSGVTWLLILPADLPNLRAEEFGRLLENRESGRAAVVESHDGGTNALLLPVLELPDQWTFQFGSGSCLRHIQQLDASGIEVRRLHSLALSQDVDTFDDYRRLTSEGACYA